MLKAGENVFAKITLADENVNRPFDTSNLVSVVENCFATQKDSPNVPQTLFIGNGCVVPGMDYFTEVIKSGLDHEIYLRFKVFEWKKAFSSSLQEIYFRCRITICDTNMESCARNCMRPMPRNRRRRQIQSEIDSEIEETEVDVLENNLQVDIETELETVQQSTGAVVTSQAILVDFEEDGQLNFPNEVKFSENLVVSNDPEFMPDYLKTWSTSQIAIIYGGIAALVVLLALAVVVLVFRVKSKTRVIQFDNVGPTGYINRATSFSGDVMPREA